MPCWRAYPKGAIDKALQDDAVEVDWRMHDEIIDSLNNEVISRNYRVNAARIRLMRVSNRLEPERLATALTEHLEVLQAAMARDADAGRGGIAPPPRCVTPARHRRTLTLQYGASLGRRADAG